MASHTSPLRNLPLDNPSTPKPTPWSWPTTRLNLHSSSATTPSPTLLSTKDPSWLELGNTTTSPAEHFQSQMISQPQSTGEKREVLPPSRIRHSADHAGPSLLLALSKELGSSKLASLNPSLSSSKFLAILHAMAATADGNTRLSISGKTTALSLRASTHTPLVMVTLALASRANSLPLISRPLAITLLLTGMSTRWRLLSPKHQSLSQSKLIDLSSSNTPAEFSIPVHAAQILITPLLLSAMHPIPMENTGSWRIPGEPSGVSLVTWDSASRMALVSAPSRAAQSIQLSETRDKLLTSTYVKALL